MAERSWAPGGDRARWQRRAELFAYLRQFFGERGVLEVDTPVLGRLGVTDPALEAPAAEGGSLQTSPEYFMKRLLAAGSGPIYQLARAFRSGEVGRRHNPEFLLLEWYRPGWDDEALRGEMDALLAPLLPGFPAERLPFDALLKQVFGLAWREAPESAWAEALAAHWGVLGREGDPLALAEGDPLTVLEWLYGEASETLQAPTFITDFPRPSPPWRRCAPAERRPRASSLWWPGWSWPTVFRSCAAQEPSGTALKPIGSGAGSSASPMCRWMKRSSRLSKQVCPPAPGWLWG